MGDWAYLDSGFVRHEEARISAHDVGFLYGVGLFETMRAYGGRVFRLTRHVERLRRSALAINLALLPAALDRIGEIITELLERNRLHDARLRLTVTPGSSLEEPQPTLLLTAGPAATYPDDSYRQGMTTVIASRRQTAFDSCCAHKVIGYQNRLLCLHEAQRKRCGEAIWFTPNGQLAEGSISNVFVVREGRLRTPPLDTPVLPGTTREAILELAQGMTDAAEKPLTISDLLDADEVFLTNVVMTVMPVVRVEQKEIGNGKPGAVTAQLRRSYLELVAEECGSGGESK